MLLLWVRVRWVSGSWCLFGAGQLQEDIFQAEPDGAQLVQIPAGIDHGAGQVGANVAALQALHLEGQAAVLGFPRQHAADAGHLLQALLDLGRIERSVGGCHFQRHGFGAAQAVGQVRHRIGGHQLALIDDDNALAGLFDFGQDVGAENDGVIAGQVLDQTRGSR